MGFTEYKGVVHVHSFLGGHSAGTFSEIISAAQANQLQFVIMTEHTEKDFDTAAMTLQGMHGGVLFINGNEVSAANGDRLLVLPGEVSIVAYPEEFKNWDTAGFRWCRGLQRFHKRATRQSGRGILRRAVVSTQLIRI